MFHTVLDTRLLRRHNLSESDISILQIKTHCFEVYKRPSYFYAAGIAS